MDSSPKNTLGRKIYKGARGGTYVLDSRGKKIYKFKPAPGPAAPPTRPATTVPAPRPTTAATPVRRVAADTLPVSNILPRGTTVTNAITAATKKTVAGATTTGDKDTTGRLILKGPKGGLFVVDKTGKKVYKFKKAPSTRPNAARPNAARPNAARPNAARPNAARPNAARPNAARPLTVAAEALDVSEILPPGVTITNAIATRARKTTAGAMTTGKKNTSGRPIFRGPKGGRFVVDWWGKKVYKFREQTAGGGGPPTNVNATGFSVDGKQNVKINIASIPIRRVVFDPNQFVRETKMITVGIKKLTSSRPNMFGIRDQNIDALNGWTARQSLFLENLSMDDYLTVCAYANRSHSWIGPYMIRQRVKALVDVSTRHSLPLYSQSKKLLVSKNIPIEDVIVRHVNMVPRENAYEKFCRPDTSERDRYQAYMVFYRQLKTRFLRKAMNMYIQDLQSIILRAPPLDKPLFAYRGSFTSYLFYDRTYTTKAFSSVAYEPEYASRYGTPGYHRMEIPPGSRVLALYLVNPWASNGEYEILLPLGTEYNPKFGKKVRRWIPTKSTVLPLSVGNFTIKTP